MLHTCWSWNSRAQAPRLVTPPSVCIIGWGLCQGLQRTNAPSQHSLTTLAQPSAETAGELWAAPQEQEKGMELNEGNRVPCPLSLRATPIISFSKKASKHWWW